MKPRRFIRSFAIALSALIAACSPRDSEPTGAPGTKTGEGGTYRQQDGTPSSSQTPSVGMTSGSSTQGGNSSQGVSGEGSPVVPPASAASH